MMAIIIIIIIIIIITAIRYRLESRLCMRQRKWLATYVIFVSPLHLNCILGTLEPCFLSDKSRIFYLLVAYIFATIASVYKVFVSPQLHFGDSQTSCFVKQVART